MLRLRAVLITCVIGAGGALLATLAGLPAAPLIGSSVAVAVAAALRVPLGMDGHLRNLAFLVIGISLGAGIDQEALAQIGHYAVSLGLMLISLTVTLLAGAALLHRLFGMSRDTAVLATSPGLLSYAVASALDGRGDPTAVMVLQVLRLLLLVTMVPFMAALLADPATGLHRPPPMPLAALAVLLILGGLLGAAGTRLYVPAAYLIAGMLVSTAVHALDLVDGTAPRWAIFGCFVITGATLGTRLTAVSRQDLSRLAGAGLALIASTVLISVIFAALATWMTGLPFDQVWIAFAPGGVEAMAAVGLAMGYDPAYIALHHFARIAILMALVPLFLGRRAG